MGSIGAYVMQRLLQVIPVLLIVSMLAFALMHIAPGEPTQILLGDFATQADIDRMNRELGLDRPLPVQYVKWLARVVQGNFGQSIINRQPVSEAIVRRLEPTFLLAALSTILAVGIGLPAGILAAVNWKKAIDQASVLLMISGVSLPSFFVAIVLIYLFAVRLGWFPTFGYVPLAEANHPWESLRSLVLPAISLALGQMALIARMARSSMLEELRADYVRTARAKGLGEPAVNCRHALKNALLPVLTVIGLAFSALASGTLVVESVFGISGLGRLLVRAVLQRDYPVVQAMLVYVAAAYVLINLVVDVLYVMVDPRVRY